MTFDGERVRAVSSNSYLFVRASSHLNRDAATKLKDVPFAADDEKMNVCA